MAKKTISKSKKVTAPKEPELVSQPVVEKKPGFSFNAMLEASKVPLLVLVVIDVLHPFLASALGLGLAVLLGLAVMGLNAVLFFWAGYNASKNFGFSELHSGAVSAFCALVLGILLTVLSTVMGFNTSNMMGYGAGQLGAAIIFIGGMIKTLASVILNFILGVIGGYLGKN